MSDLSRERIGEIAALIATLREPSEDSVIVAVGAHGPSFDSRCGHFSATVTRHGVTETSEAVHLHDAILLARAKITATIAKREKAREKDQAAKATQSKLEDDRHD